MSGASRWLDAPAPLGPRPATPAARASPSAASAVPRRRVLVERIVPPSNGDCAGLGSALLHRRMGGCEIPLTDPSVSPLAPNIPFVAITSRDHLRSGGRAADA